MMRLPITYKNGNALITLDNNGTRVIESPDDVLILTQPLNIDIRVTNRCSNGLNPMTGNAICSYCHESARTDGIECDYEFLKDSICHLEPGIELAIGGNVLSKGLNEFLLWSRDKGFICNLTINQLHLTPKNLSILEDWIHKDCIKGIGISMRDFNYPLPPLMNNYPHTVLHVIAGIDNIHDVISYPFGRWLVLGYKSFGFGKDFYSQEVESNINRWLWNLPLLINSKELISFDNLGLEQLNVKRFISNEHWDEVYQGEYSMYINAVDKYYAPSSRTHEGSMNMSSISLLDYWSVLKC